MNKLFGRINDIQVNGDLSLVSVQIGEQLILKTIVIETPQTASYLQKNRKIAVLFKETEVVIGRNEKHAISLQNRIQGKVQSIEHGSLISRIFIQTTVGVISSIISTHAVRQLELAAELPVIAMIKLNEIMLSEK